MHLLRTLCLASPPSLLGWGGRSRLVNNPGEPDKSYIISEIPRCQIIRGI